MDEKLSENHKFIWLKPVCELDERTWCPEPQGDCGESGCGEKEVKYIRADLVEPMREALEETQKTLNQALGVIVEFGNLNGFRNLSNSELGKTVVVMAKACDAQIDKARAALALADRGD